VDYDPNLLILFTGVGTPPPTGTPLAPQEADLLTPVGLSVGGIAGIVVAGIVIVALVVVFAVKPIRAKVMPFSVRSKIDSLPTQLKKDSETDSEGGGGGGESSQGTFGHKGA